ncbi:Bridging integrator 2 [Bagarius yarrelli]|uniref:Bridging integrator 2 n=1 Tax=Bagarius yarrelli TaxID=175774 RepID=A0A556V2H1_BAGYA|nr:Bridging integrator 2 [Bagarius yarrelli]
MAERKSSTSPSLQSSKGGAGKFAKQVQRKFSRAQEKVLQKFNMSEETRDEQFEECIQNFQDQQTDGQKIYKDLKAYLNSVRVMRDASSRLFQSLFDVYELDWEGGEDLGAVVESEDLLWNDYEAKLRDQALLTMESYISQFPDMRERIAKRSRKLVDYDSTRHQLESLQNAKKKDDIKIDKAEEMMKMTKAIFEDMNRGLKEEMPLLYDSRIGVYVTVFQAISNLRDIFYKEMSQNNKDLQTIMMNLKAQHPDKKFVVKTFSRGTLKRRSLKDALSPTSLKASFSELHMNYSSRGTLRREQTSSFRSDKRAYEPYNQEVVTSPSRPKPPRNADCGFRDADESSSSEKNQEIDGTVSTTNEHLVEDTNASVCVENITKNDAQQENEGSETKERELPPASEQVGEKINLDIKSDSSPETNNKIKQESNKNHTERGDTRVLFSDNTEEHSIHSEEMDEPGPGMENEIDTNFRANLRPDISC